MNFDTQRVKLRCSQTSHHSRGVYRPVQLYQFSTAPVFDHGRLDRIFISRANGVAGISPKNFADQFRVSSKARVALDAGQITLAPGANTTIENALETACWLDAQSGVSEVVLIAGRHQKPRASWALESALAESVSVRRLIVLRDQASVRFNRA